VPGVFVCRVGFRLEHGRSWSCAIRRSSLHLPMVLMWRGSGVGRRGLCVCVLRRGGGFVAVFLATVHSDAFASRRLPIVQEQFPTPLRSCIIAFLLSREYVLRCARSLLVILPCARSLLVNSSTPSHSLFVLYLDLECARRRRVRDIDCLPIHKAELCNHTQREHHR